MKNKLFYLVLTGCLLTFAACENNDFEDALLTKSGSVLATLPDADTKTVIDGLQVLWSESDAISMFTATEKHKGTITDGKGTKVATFGFESQVNDTKVAAVYPYYDVNAYDAQNAKISMTMPDSYTYVENGIGGAPMAALITDQDAPIAFKNAGALMGLTVNNIPAGYNKAILTSLGEEAVAGPCEITFDNAGNPTIKATAEATGKSVTISFEPSAEVTSKTFYFPIPVANYSSLQLAISNGTNTKVIKTKALNAQRSMRYKSEQDTPVDVQGAAAATEALQDGETSVNVTIGTGETNPTISLPASNAQTSLSFESIPSGQTVAIVEAASANVSEEVSISASSNSESNNSFNIVLPNSTVTLNANGVSATYQEVTALTATNTLIVSKGVIVNSLIVRGGNVRVFGKIGHITRDENENSDEYTYLIFEEGAEIPESENLGDKIKVISAAEYDLRKAIADETILSYQLTGNVELTESLLVPKDKIFTLNLNGNTISQEKECTASYSMITNKGVLTIVGTGKISFKDTSAGDPNFGWGSYTVANYGTLVVEGVTIEHLGDQNKSGNVVHMYSAIQQGHGAVSTTINGGTISTPTYRSIRINVGALIVNGGVMEGQVWLQPNQGNVTIDVKGGDFSPRGGDGSSIFLTNQGENYTVTSASFTDGKFNTKIGATNPSLEGVKGSVKSGIFTETAKNYTNSNLISASSNFESNADGTYTLVNDPTKAVVETETELLAALENQAVTTIVLKNSFKLEAAAEITADKTVVLDLNGETISQESDLPVSMIINSGNLTIKDSKGNGKIAFAFTGTPDTRLAANTVANKGKLVVEGGEISNVGKGNQIGYAIDTYNGSTLTINGGKISASGSSYYDGIRLFCGNKDITVTVNNGEISSIWAQNPSENKATEVKGTIIINGGTIGATYFENYTIVKVATGISATVTPYGIGSDNTTSEEIDGYTVYSFVHDNM